MKQTSLIFSSIVGVAFFLTGCSATPVRLAAALSPAFASTPSPTGPRVASRGYLTPGEEPSSESGAYAFVLFTSKPNHETQARYALICEAYQAALPTSQDLNTERVDLQSQVITYWPLHSGAPLHDASPNCAQLVSEYDYARAALLASQLSKQGSSGPLLVAWRAPKPGTVPADALVLDLSNFDDEDLGAAFAIWRGRVTQDPSIWNKGFRLLKVRVALHSFIQKYGATILAVVQPKDS